MLIIFRQIRKQNLELRLKIPPLDSKKTELETYQLCFNGRKCFDQIMLEYNVWLTPNFDFGHHFPTFKSYTAVLCVVGPSSTTSGSLCTPRLQFYSSKDIKPNEILAVKPQLGSGNLSLQACLLWSLDPRMPECWT
jgi:hypothetical protein